MSRLLALLLLAVLPAMAQAVAPPVARDSVADRTKGPSNAPPYRVRQTLNLRYHPGNGRQTLDVFQPVGKAAERFPVVLFVHGGTWMFGDKNFFGMYRNVGQNLASNGIVTVMINYRLSPGVKHPEHIKDVARAFAWTVRHIDRYGGDPDRLILAGHSAGGHLVALLATDDRYLKDPKLELTPQQRKRIRGVICLSGVYRVPPPEEFRTMAERIARNWVGDPTKSGMAMLLEPAVKSLVETANPFHLVFGTSKDVQVQASPLSHVHKGLPPFLLLLAEREAPRLYVMAEDFEAALRKAGNAVEVKEIDGCTHHNIVKLLHRNDNEATRSVLAFIRRTAAPAGNGS
jgi:acetyl esterase/lipase